MREKFAYFIHLIHMRCKCQVRSLNRAPTVILDLIVDDGGRK